MMDYDWDRLAGLYPQDFIEKMKSDPCRKGYAMLGQKKKGGRTVPNCVKLDSKHNEGDIATAEMTPNYLPKKEIPGGGDLRTPRMAEAAQRMPRDTVLKKLNDKDGLAMEAVPNFAEDGDMFNSDESNASMALTQIRVIREKCDILLGMLYPDDNLPPWMATKITMSAQNMASVADALRFGAEHQ
jgi:hypothetical protein